MNLWERFQAWRHGPDQPEHLRRGQLGERAAKKHLRRLGLKFLTANFRSRRGEIDLVFRESECLVFVEVKTRASDWFAPPQVNVDLRKRRQVARAARAYRRLLELDDQPYRYDVVTVILPPDETPRIDLIRNYWTF